jgi:hypothetical protein
VLIDQYCNVNYLIYKKSLVLQAYEEEETAEERVKVRMFLSLSYWMFYGNWCDALPKDRTDENYEFRESNLSKQEVNLLSMLERMI